MKTQHKADGYYNFRFTNATLSRAVNDIPNRNGFELNHDCTEVTQTIFEENNKIRVGLIDWYPTKQESLVAKKSDDKLRKLIGKNLREVI